MRGKRFRITQGFGERPEVYQQFGLDGHNGYDLAPPRFLPKGRKITIYAPHDGYVTLGDQGDQGYGVYLKIRSLPINNQGLRRQSTLAHLEEYYVSHNDFVYAGDPVAYLQVGRTTGFSTGTHVHWTLKPLVSTGKMFPKNGYNGAVDVGTNTLIWTSRTLQ